MKRVLLILLMSCMLLSFVGCKGSFAKQKLIAQLREETNTYWGTVEFTADSFAQVNISAWMNYITIKVEDSNIYVNDILYDSVEIVDDPEITYFDGFLEYQEDGVAEILTQIQSSENCYILKTQDSMSHTGEKMAVYCIDGTCYFVCFVGDNTVLRIHAATN